MKLQYIVTGITIFICLFTFFRKSSSSSPTTATNRSVSMFFQSLLPTFNINNPGGEQRNAAEAAAGGAANVEDEVAQVDRHLQALNANLENVDAEGT